MKRLFTALTLALLPNLAFAESRIAVLDIEGDLTPKVRQQLSDEVRVGV